MGPSLRRDERKEGATACAAPPVSATLRKAEEKPAYAFGVSEGSSLAADIWRSAIRADFPRRSRR